MRLRDADGATVHLAYCTNVHAAEDFDGDFFTFAPAE